MIIDNKFYIGDILYLRTDIDQKPGIVTSIEVYKAGEYMYKVAFGSAHSYHYDFELTTNKNELIAL